MIRILLVIITLIVGFDGLAQTVDPGAVDGEIHFKISDDPGLLLDGYTGGNLTLDALFAVSGLDSIFKPFPLPGTELDSIYRVVFPNALQVDALTAALGALPYVEFAEKNPIMTEFNTPNDLQSGQWSLEKIQAELAWDYSTGSTDVLVAVLDDAIAIDHEDLSANIYINAAEQDGLPLLDDDVNGRSDDVNGFDVADGDNDPRPPANASGNSDGFTHGTHVAGIVSAATNNGTGMASIGYNTKILPVKIGRDSDAAFVGAGDGLYYAMRSGVDIINMSFGTSTNAATLKALVAQINAAGIVMVAAAGNDGDQQLHYPAAYPEVISVGATDQNDEKASFSNYGNTIDVMAPGVGIYSTLPEGNNTYGNYNGTSMATPLVSGLAALVVSHFPGISSSQLRSKIEDGCEDISAQNPGMSGMLGAGRINAYRTIGNVGIDEVDESAVQMWPNPASDVLNIQTDESFKPERIDVADMTGRIVVSTSFTRSLDLSKLDNGVYSVVISDNGSVSSSKIVLQ